MTEATNSLSGNVIAHAEVADFLEFIEDCQLEKMSNTRGKYIWNDRQDQWIFSKLDWVYMNGDWIDSMPDM